MLWHKALPDADLVIRGARVLDPTEGIDGRLDVRIDGGTIADVAEQVDANEHRVVEANGLVLAPAFVDPHVHLRTPGREDEETVASGTAAAAAGGYCAILAMPNTDPVVDSAATLGALVESARRDAAVPTGFLAAITRGQRGEELTEMGELAETGAVAFSAELGFAGYPSSAESVAVERDLALAGYERGRVHVLHLSAAESVDALRRAREAGIGASGEATPHHLVLTDDAVRSLDPNVKMNPPLRAEHDRLALLEALRDGTIEAVATDHAPHAVHEKEVPFEAAPFGVTGLETAFAAVYTHLVKPGVLPLETLLERMSAGPARIFFGLDRPRVAAGAQANLVLLDLEQEWTVGEQPFRSRSGNSWLLGSTLRGGVRMTLAGGSVVHE